MPSYGPLEEPDSVAPHPGHSRMVRPAHRLRRVEAQLRGKSQGLGDDSSVARVEEPAAVAIPEWILAAVVGQPAHGPEIGEGCEPMIELMSDAWLFPPNARFPVAIS
jgi:hypothetical protein